jgi:hypothetical protein
MTVSMCSLLVEFVEYLEDTLDALEGEREGAVPIEQLEHYATS